MNAPCWRGQVASEGFRAIALTNGQNREQARTWNSRYT